MKRAIYTTLGVAVLLIVTLLVWGTVIGPYNLERRDITAPVPNLPDAWQGEQIAMIADFQVGMWLDNSQVIEDVASRIDEIGPAAVLIAGDFIYSPISSRSVQQARQELDDDDRREVLSELDEALNYLSPVLDSETPVYAVLGNHDYALSSPADTPLNFLAREVRERLEQRGVIVLQNRSVALSAPGGGDEPLNLVGVGSRYADNDHIGRALTGLAADAPRLVLMHNPDSFPDFPTGSAPVALSGHTHGGQIRLPWLPQWSWMSMVQPNDAHVDGWVEEGFGAAGNRLFVNRGIGFSLLPIRFNATPELTLVTLERAGSGSANQ